jgi:hypothetical protein
MLLRVFTTIVLPVDDSNKYQLAQWNKTGQNRKGRK